MVFVASQSVLHHCLSFRGSRSGCLLKAFAPLCQLAAKSQCSDSIVQCFNFLPRGMNWYSRSRQRGGEQRANGLAFAREVIESAKVSPSPAVDNASHPIQHRDQGADVRRKGLVAPGYLGLARSASPKSLPHKGRRPIRLVRRALEAFRKLLRSVFWLSLVAIMLCPLRQVGGDRFSISPKPHADIQSSERQEIRPDPFEIAPKRFRPGDRVDKPRHVEQRPHQKKKSKMGFAALAPQKGQPVTNESDDETGVEDKEERLIDSPVGGDQRAKLLTRRVIGGRGITGAPGPIHGKNRDRGPQDFREPEAEKSEKAEAHQHRRVAQFRRAEDEHRDYDERAVDKDRPALRHIDWIQPKLDLLLERGRIGPEIRHDVHHQRGERRHLSRRPRRGRRGVRTR